MSIKYTYVSKALLNCLAKQQSKIEPASNPSGTINTILAGWLAGWDRDELIEFPFLRFSCMHIGTVVLVVVVVGKFDLALSMHAVCVITRP